MSGSFLAYVLEAATGIRFHKYGFYEKRGNLLSLQFRCLPELVSLSPTLWGAEEKRWARMGQK